MFPLTIISRVLDNGILQGYVFAVYDEDKQNYDVTYGAVGSIERIVQAYKDPKFVNCEFDEATKAVKGTPISLDNYPEITKDYTILKNNGLILLAEIEDADKGIKVGALCANGIGKLYQLSYDKIRELSNAYPLINFTISDKTIEAKTPYAIPVLSYKMRTAQKNTYSSKDGETAANTINGVKKSILSNEADEVGILDLDAAKKSEFNKSAQEKLTLALANMMKITPYYACVMEAIPRHQTVDEGIETMAVTESEMYYNLKFVAEHTVPELTFVLIHEINHILQQHAVRGKGKNHMLFNIACDIFINELICRDFGCYFGGPAVQINGGSIKTPTEGCFLANTGLTLDFNVDTPESLYAELLKENNNKPQLQPQNNTSQSGQSQGNKEAVKQVLQEMLNETKASGNKALADELKDIANAIMKSKTSEEIQANMDKLSAVIQAA